LAVAINCTTQAPAVGEVAQSGIISAFFSEALFRFIPVYEAAMA
jgi:hypothetical protein